jgi:transcriptional regulator with PAS, ATPase and Fis domain
MAKQTNMMAIYVDDHNQIIEWQGKATDVFGFAPLDFVQSGMHILQIPWDAVVENPPNLNNNLSILQSINGPLVLLSIVNISKTVGGNGYVLVLSRLDHIFDVQTEAPLPANSVNEIFAESEKMKKIIDIIYKVANVDSTVLLLGESGVGKTMIARFIHQVSSRREYPFVSVNCGTLPDSLIESELFGYEAGSFTGGKTGGKKGLLEAAEGGTLFLDEIAELPYHVQSKLLEVLQENMFRKIGSVKRQSANIRIVAATNKNLRELVDKNIFREDLYYRLHVVPLTIPPLRERQEEILPLAEYFVQMFNRKYKRRFFLSPQIKERFMRYEWPGNIRELKNMVERMVVTQSEEIPEQLGETPEHGNILFSFQSATVLPPLKEAKKQLEKELILRAYHIYENTYRVAEALQVDQSTIVKKLKQYRNEGNESVHKRSKKG